MHIGTSISCVNGSTGVHSERRVETIYLEPTRRRLEMLQESLRIAIPMHQFNLFLYFVALTTQRSLTSLEKKHGNSSMVTSDHSFAFR